MDAEIFSIGSELVLGQLIDTNAAYLSHELAALGIDVRFHTTTGDDKERLAEALRASSVRVNLILTTGGLGPTRDDVSRYAISSICGKPLQLHAPSLKRLRAFFAHRGRQMPEANAIQAMFPQGAKVIRNVVGTAPGFRVQAGKCEIIAMPGVPQEMTVMLKKYVLPYLRRKNRRSSRMISTKMLKCFGVPESTIGEAIHDLMDPCANPTVGTQASGGVISLRILARGRSRQARQALIRRAERRLRKEFGDAVFGAGEETLQGAVAKLLERRGVTLAVAESCTGGLIGNLLTDVPGISRFFLEDIVAYSNEAKVRRLSVPRRMIATFGAVSREVAEAMARGIRRRTGADMGLSITGIAGPAGGSKSKPVGLVHMAVAAESGVTHEEHRLSGQRITIKNRSAKYALNLLRLCLLSEGC